MHTRMPLLKRYFVTGVIIFVPLLITLYVLSAVFQLVNGVFGTYLDVLVSDHLPFPLPGFGFVMTILLILFAGVFASSVIGRKLLNYGEGLLYRVPIAKTVYGPAKQIIDFLFSPKQASFKQVALVEYPKQGIYSIGFVTGKALPETYAITGKRLLHVLIPNAPTPASGFLILVPEDEVHLLDISFDEALKLIISGGVLTPDLKLELPMSAEAAEDAE